MLYLLAVHPGCRIGHRLVEPVTKEIIRIVSPILFSSRYFVIPFAAFILSKLIVLMPVESITFSASTTCAEESRFSETIRSTRLRRFGIEHLSVATTARPIDISEEKRFGEFTQRWSESYHKFLPFFTINCNISGVFSKSPTNYAKCPSTP